MHFLFQNPDPKEMQMNLTGFLHSKYARIFLQELWDLLLSAQETVGGIPAKFVEQKKEEIRLKKVVMTHTVVLIKWCSEGCTEGAFVGK